MNQEKIGKFIAELRKEKNLLQKELAEKLGVDNRTISRWETGRCMPDLSMFPLISKELGVTINDLMSGEIVDKNDYQAKLEKNIVNSIAKIQHRNKILYHFLFTLIFVVIIFITCWLIFNNVYFSLHYDEDKMYIEESEYGLRFANKNLCTIFESNFEKEFTSINVGNEEIGIVFLSAKCSIANHINFYNQGPTSYRWYYIEIPENDFPDKYRIYYTKENLNNVTKLKKDELLDFTEKSHLMYEN